MVGRKRPRCIRNCIRNLACVSPRRVRAMKPGADHGPGHSRCQPFLVSPLADPAVYPPSQPYVASRGEGLARRAGEPVEQLGAVGAGAEVVHTLLLSPEIHPDLEIGTPVGGCLPAPVPPIHTRPRAGPKCSPAANSFVICELSLSRATRRISWPTCRFWQQLRGDHG